MMSRRPPLLVLLLVSCASAAVAARDVRVQIYMETLCPYCANATIYQVAPIVAHPILGQAVALEYIPWGNAKLGPAPPPLTTTTTTTTTATATTTTTTTTTSINDDEAPRCQHGAVECALNALLSCSIALSPTTWFDFAVCLEETVLAKGNLTTAAVAEKCAAATSPPQSAELAACAEGAMGRALSRTAGERTAALVPPHEYVPWFVVNGVALRSAADQLLAFVCVALDPGQRALAADVCGDPAIDGDDDGDLGEGAGERRGAAAVAAGAVGPSVQGLQAAVAAQ